MPTGYTAAIIDSNLTDFSTFAMRCARAFGPFARFSDGPIEAEMPEEFKVPQYYIDQEQKAYEHLANLLAMDVGQIQIAYDEFAASLIEDKRIAIVVNDEKRNKYHAMLDQVLDWDSEEPFHLEMKKFMVEQLNISIECDCFSETVLDQIYTTIEAHGTVDEWYEKMTKAAKERVEKARSDLKREIGGVAFTNNRLKTLRDALPKKEGEPK